MKIQIIVDHVLDKCAKKHHIGAATDRYVPVRKRRGTGIARIHVNYARPALFSFDYPLETHRMALGHIRALNQDARSEEHTSELQSRGHLVCRLLLDKKNPNK